MTVQTGITLFQFVLEKCNYYTIKKSLYPFDLLTYFLETTKYILKNAVQNMANEVFKMAKNLQSTFQSYTQSLKRLDMGAVVTSQQLRALPEDVGSQNSRGSSQLSVTEVRVADILFWHLWVLGTQQVQTYLQAKHPYI